MLPRFILASFIHAKIESANSSIQHSEQMQNQRYIRWQLKNCISSPKESCATQKKKTKKRPSENGSLLQIADDIHSSDIFFSKRSEEEFIAGRQEACAYVPQEPELTIITIIIIQRIKWPYKKAIHLALNAMDEQKCHCTVWWYTHDATKAMYEFLSIRFPAASERNFIYNNMS